MNIFKFFDFYFSLKKFINNKINNFLFSKIAFNENELNQNNDLAIQKENLHFLFQI